MIDTSTRVFKAVVGPSGSGKAVLISKFLMEIFFTLYKEMHPALSEKVFSRNINVKLMKIDGFESKRKLEKFLLVLDDSYENILNANEFLRQATTGRHRWLDEIIVKLNLFQQSQRSRTIDLNTSHIFFVQIAS